MPTGPGDINPLPFHVPLPFDDLPLPFACASTVVQLPFVGLSLPSSTAFPRPSNHPAAAFALPFSLPLTLPLPFPDLPLPFSLSPTLHCAGPHHGASPDHNVKDPSPCKTAPNPPDCDQTKVDSGRVE